MEISFNLKNNIKYDEKSYTKSLNNNAIQQRDIFHSKTETIILKIKPVTLLLFAITLNFNFSHIHNPAVLNKSFILTLALVALSTCFTITVQ